MMLAGRFAMSAKTIRLHLHQLEKTRAKLSSTNLLRNANELLTS